MNTSIHGTGVALVTPFLPTNAVDHEALQQLVNHVIQGGVNFLVILGTTGESATLSLSEQDEVIKTVLGANDGRLPYVIGAGGNNTSSVVRRVRELDEKYDADAYLSVVPYYNKPSQEGLIRHFSSIAEATAKEIILYNVPGRTAISMEPSTSLRLAEKFSNISAIKEASGDLEACMDLVTGAPEGFGVLSGDDSLILPQLAVGMKGIISVTANAIPAEFSAIVNAGLKGKFEEARRLHLKHLALMRMLFVEGNPTGVKAALAALGIGSTTVRPPLLEASPQLRELLSKELEELGIL